MPPRADELVRRSDFARLRELLVGMALAAGTRGLELAEEQVGEPIDIDLTDPAAPVRRQILADIGLRVTGIADDTRRRVHGYVGQAVADGWSPQHLARLIAEDPSGAFSRSRALVIARTETGNVYNRVSAAGWRASGRVKKVRVFDGDQCSWPTGHGAGNANGITVDLDDFEAHPLAHPNCVRSGAPVVE